MALNGLLVRKCANLSLKEAGPLQQLIRFSHGPNTPLVTRLKIGTREIVGYGINGEPIYFDKIDRPMPAIRYKEVTPEIAVLHEKEKGDWKKLSIEEKKALYRASFCQTFSEMQAPTGEWKYIAGGTMLFVSFGIWLYILCKVFVYQPLPHTFSKEHQEAMLQKMIDTGVNRIDGLASKWDYEKNEWKE